MRVEVRLPEPGLLRWLWDLALGEVALLDGLRVVSVEPWGLVVEVKPEDFVDALRNAFNSYRYKASGAGPRLTGGADKAIIKNLGLEENTLGAAFVASMSHLMGHVEAGFDVVESLGGLTVDRRRGVWMGLDSTFVTPSFLKNIEYLEHKSGFLSPSIGAISMVKMDVLWLALLLLGFYIGYAGFYGGGALHLVVKEDLEQYMAGPRRLLESAMGTVKWVADVAGERRRMLDVEEVYEMDLALGLAEMLSSGGLGGLLWPVTVVRARKMGQVFVADRVVHLRLDRLVSFAARYREELGRLKGMGYRLGVKWGDSEVTPLEWLVRRAELEVAARRGRDSSGEAVALLAVKDLYRAVEAGSVKLVEEALLRLARRAAATRDSAGQRMDYPMNVFVSGRHLEALLRAAEGAGG